MLLGVIDGFTSGFNETCRSGLANTVRSSFSVVDNIDFYNPKKLAKFQISNVGLTEATNIVYAYCDISALLAQFSKLFDYENPEQYITVASRVGGVFMSTWPKLTKCVTNGKTKENGYDVGFCGSTLASQFLDISL